MTELKTERFALSTGVELDVMLGGDATAPAIFFLHGFPESHRTWRHQLPEFARDHFVVAPDQRGFAGSSKPAEQSDYTSDRPVADLIALADRLGVDRFTLVGHDWGGAIAWMAALAHPQRIERLVIINAPHPFIFQKSLFDDPAQREASQYINAFRNPGIEMFVEAMGLEKFFDTAFGSHADLATIGDEKAVYLEQWSQPGALTAMLNWYRAASIIVPTLDETPERPAFLDAPFPAITMPALVIWGMQDKALLPVQLDGLDRLAPDHRLITVDAGHFVSWEKPEAVNDALRNFLA